MIHRITSVRDAGGRALGRTRHVDFIRYAEGVGEPLNTELADRDDLVAHLTGRQWLHPQCTDRDAAALRRFQKDWPVFEASEAENVPP